MLYLIYGNDFEKARGKARELIADLQKRKPNAEVFRLEDEMVSAGKLDELSGGQGLFERKYIVFADHVFRSAEAKEIVLKKLKSLADSENVFIFLEDELGKADLKSALPNSSSRKIKTFSESASDLSFLRTISLASAERKTWSAKTIYFLSKSPCPPLNSSNFPALTISSSSRKTSALGFLFCKSAISSRALPRAFSKSFP